ncbi:MAG: TraB domain-containing protein [Candidatus Woesearchaeota archaeon]
MNSNSFNYSFNNIFLIGTSHVALESIEKIKKGFSISPEIVAVELDFNRAVSLESDFIEKTKEKREHEIDKKKGKQQEKQQQKETIKEKIKKNLSLIKEIGFLGFLFYLLGKEMQEKYGSILNINPGLDMYEAIKLAREKNLEIYFIDRDIKITLKRFSKNIKKREIIKIIFQFIISPFYFIYESFLTLISNLFNITNNNKQKNKKNKKKEIDLTKVPSNELIDYILKEVKKEYPSIYKVLIDERDLFMAKKLFILSKKNPDKKILAVVGAGHLKGILTYLEKLSESHADIAY